MSGRRIYPVTGIELVALCVAGLMAMMGITLTVFFWVADAPASAFIPSVGLAVFGIFFGAATIIHIVRTTDFGDTQ